MNPGEKNKFSNSLHLFTKVIHCIIYRPWHRDLPEPNPYFPNRIPIIFPLPGFQDKKRISETARTREIG